MNAPWLTRFLSVLLLTFSRAAQATIFSNTVPISIPESGVASPYPSSITVSGMAGSVGKLTVTLYGFSHTYPNDLDVLLVSPGGQRVMLMSTVGGPTDLTNVFFKFDDAGAPFPNVLPNIGSNATVVYHPVNRSSANLPAPAPLKPYDTNLAAFNGSNPNGTWQLFVNDHNTSDFGVIAAGWSLNLEAISFANPNLITIPDSGKAAPYPSTIIVSGASGSVNKVSVTLNGLFHSYASDLDILLIGPGGQSVMLMSSMGANNDFTNATVAFDDAAAGSIPDNVPVIPSGIYKPGDSGIFTPLPPAPPRPYETNLAAFSGTLPNGTWKLFVNDHASSDSGMISNGWSLNLYLVPRPDNDDFANSIVLAGTNLTLFGSTDGATAEPGEPYYDYIDIENLAFCVRPGTNASVWWSWTAPAKGQLVFLPCSVLPDQRNRAITVYTGSAVNNLTRIGGTFIERTFDAVCVDLDFSFKAVGGINYHFAVDAARGSSTNGPFTYPFIFIPAPANDDFANSVLVNAPSFTASGIIVAASAEPGEPAHPTSSGGAESNSVWWTWTAPAGNGITTGMVTLSVAGDGFIPALGVYQGNSLPSLAPVPVTVLATNTTAVGLGGGSGTVFLGMNASRHVVFPATAGQTYRIAVAGPGALGTEGGATNLGKFDLSLNFTALWLEITNLTLSINTNTTSVTTNSATARVHNQGTATSGPLRIRVRATPGYSLDHKPCLPRSLPPLPLAQDLTNVLVAKLGPGQTSMATPIRAGLPAPSIIGDPPVFFGVGWGAEAWLEEQLGTNWLLVDKKTISYGLWPDLLGFLGPDAGVLRLDSGLAAPQLVQVSSDVILGPMGMNEGTSNNYFCKVTFTDGSMITFTNTAWFVSPSSPAFSITTNGVLTVGSVTNNTNCTITAPYYFRAIPHQSSKVISITNRQPPSFTMGALVPGGLQLTLLGVSNRLHTIEAANALSNAPLQTVWTPIATNKGLTNGLWLYVDPSVTIRTQRFYRAREGP